MSPFLWWLRGALASLACFLGGIAAVEMQRATRHPR